MAWWIHIAPALITESATHFSCRVQLHRRFITPLIHVTYQLHDTLYRMQTDCVFVWTCSAKSGLGQQVPWWLECWANNQEVIGSNTRVDKVKNLSMYPWARHLTLFAPGVPNSYGLPCKTTHFTTPIWCMWHTVPDKSLDTLENSFKTVG